MTTLLERATLTADLSPAVAVVLCSCGARVADTRPSIAWTLAARHVTVHGPKAAPAYRAAMKYARDHRRKGR